MNEMRRDLQGMSTAHTQSTTKIETLAGTVASRLEAVTKALQDGVKDSAQVTSKITSDAQTAMSTELKNTREQINQIQRQLGEVQQAGKQMSQTAQTLESILGGTKSRGSFRRGNPRTPPRRFSSALPIFHAIPIPQRGDRRRRHFPARQENDGRRFQISP